MADARRMAAAAALGAALVGSSVSVRTAERWRGAVHPEAGAVTRALEAALPADARAAGAWSLVLLADPACGACRRAEDDLVLEVRSGDLGVRALVLRRGEAAGRAAFDVLGRGPLPVYVLADEHARPVSVLRGYRPAPFVREWLESSLAAVEGGAVDPP